MIEQSLYDKISENEQKVQFLFQIKKKIDKKNLIKKKFIDKNNRKGIMNISLLQKNRANNTHINKSQEKERINSFISNKENQKNLINVDASPILKTSINTNKKSNKKNNKCTSIKKPEMKTAITESNCVNNKVKEGIKMKPKELDCFINSKRKLSKSQNLKKCRKNSENCKKSEKNCEKNNSKSSAGGAKSTRASAKSLLRPGHKKKTKSFDFNLTYGRFIENEEKKNERINKIKKCREKLENRIFPHQPKINSKSKRMSKKSITENFLKRLEDYKIKQIEKDEILKKTILKDESERINKNNFLLTKKKLEKKKRKTSKTRRISNNKIIEASVNKLLEWEKRRKEKLENEIKKKDLMEQMSHRPKINKNIIVPKEDKTIQKIFERLYTNNKYIFGFKKEVSTQESTPKFQTFITKTKSLPNFENNIKKTISCFSFTNNDFENETINNDQGNKLRVISSKEEDISSTINSINIIEEDFKITANYTDRMIINNEKTNESLYNKETNRNILMVIRKIKTKINGVNKINSQ